MLWVNQTLVVKLIAIFLWRSNSLIVNCHVELVVHAHETMEVIHNHGLAHISIHDLDGAH
jgi:hypothetical protein